MLEKKKITDCQQWGVFWALIGISPKPGTLGRIILHQLPSTQSTNLTPLPPKRKENMFTQKISGTKVIFRTHGILCRIITCST